MAKAFGDGEIQHWANTSKRCEGCLHRYATQMPKREKLHLCWKRFIEENTKRGEGDD